MQSMKISIAMATYNGAQFLLEQLQSFLHQSRLPDELVITDDCSRDSTMEIIKAYAETAPFEVIFSQNKKNLGYAANFNKAIMGTSGDLVFLSDQDDVWFPDKISSIEKLALENSDKWVFMNDAALTDAELNNMGITKLEQLKSSGLDKQKYVMGSTSALRREFINLFLPIPDEYRAHDVWIMKFAEVLSTKLLTDKVLQYYRRHERNASVFITSRKIRVTQSDILFHKLKKKLTFRTGREKFKYRIYRQKLYLFAIERALDKKPQQYEEILESSRKKVKRKLKSLEERQAIRDKSFFFRIFFVIKYLFSGKYRKTAGFISAFRDLLRV